MLASLNYLLNFFEDPRKLNVITHTRRHGPDPVVVDRRMSGTERVIEGTKKRGAGYRRAMLVMCCESRAVGQIMLSYPI